MSEEQIKGSENEANPASVRREVLRLDKDYATALLGKLSAMKTLAECIESKTADVNVWIRCLGLGIEIAREIEPQLRSVVYREYVDAGFVCPKCWDRCNGYGNGCKCSP
jgi:hypothetical protein